jgi:GcrA cell cycle regulator
MTDLVTWTDERVEQLTKLWGDGFSASQCAAQIGGFRHCVDGGRSAVIGKVHRLGLSGRPSHRIKPTGLSRRIVKPSPKPAAAKPDRATMPMHPLPPPGKIPVSVIQKTHKDYLKSDHCRYHYGAVTDATGGFCEHASAPGIAYCAGHAVLCFAPAPPRRPSTFQDGPKTKDRTTVFGKQERILA